MINKPLLAFKIPFKEDRKIITLRIVIAAMQFKIAASMTSLHTFFLKEHF